MFKRKPKIKELAAVSAGDFVFVYGLGVDGKVYAWHPGDAQWKLHQVPPQETKVAPNV